MHSVHSACQPPRCQSDAQRRAGDATTASSGSVKKGVEAAGVTAGIAEIAMDRRQKSRSAEEQGDEKLVR
jgi:hypothetical protein